jgi:hypothetical protein
MPIQRDVAARCPEARDSGLLSLCTFRRLGVAALLAVCLLVLTACSGLSSLKRKEPSSPFSLFLALEKDQFLPGEPILVWLELKRSWQGNIGHALQPDHETVRFMLRPDRDGGEREVTFVEPVYSPQEPTKMWTELAPGAGVQRRFLFTVLTFERGSFAVAAEYEVPDPNNASSPVKIYSPPVVFKVEGQKVFARRYLNGLLYREDAYEIAKKKVQGEILDTNGIWASDEKGFLKWWINVRSRGADDKEEIRSFLVDPYLARVENAPKPFEKSEEDLAPPFPRDSKRIQDLREKAREKASGKVGQAGGEAAPAAAKEGQSAGKVGPAADKVGQGAGAAK